MMKIDEKKIEELKATALEIRKEIITMLTQAGSGHTAGSLDMVEILVALYFCLLRHDPQNPEWRPSLPQPGGGRRRGTRCRDGQARLTGRRLVLHPDTPWPGHCHWYTRRSDHQPECRGAVPRVPATSAGRRVAFPPDCKTRTSAARTTGESS